MLVENTLDPSRCDHLNIARNANSGFRQRFAILLPVSNFITDDAAQFSIDLLLTLPVTHAAEVEIGAVADVKLILVRPADEAVILVGDLHDRIKSLLAGLCNGLGDLSLLVALDVVALTTTNGNDSWQVSMFKLPMRALLPVEGETRQL